MLTTRPRWGLRRRGLAVALVLGLAALTVGALLLRTTNGDSPEFSRPPPRGSVIEPASPSGTILVHEGSVQGTVTLPAGTLAFVTAWSEVEQLDYGIQLLGLSGPFQLSIPVGVPNEPGNYTMRLWAVSTPAAEFLQTHLPTPKDNCAEGFAGLHQVRSGRESDPVELLHEAAVPRGAIGIDEAERAPASC